MVAVWSGNHHRTYDLFGPSLDLRGRDYVRVFMAPSPPLRHESRPYVDEGGFGIVRTMCTRSVGLEGLEAVFCVDITLPIHADVEADGGALFDYALLSAETHGSSVSVERMGDLGPFSGDDLQLVRATLRREVASVTEARRAQREVLTSARRVGSRDERDPDAWSFIVPLRRQGDRVVLLLLRGSPPSTPSRSTSRSSWCSPPSSRRPGRSPSGGSPASSWRRSPCSGTCRSAPCAPARTT